MSDFKVFPLSSAAGPIPQKLSAGVDANTIIEGGRLVWLRKDTGYATTSTYALANPLNVTCWGICDTRVDNSTPTGGAAINSAGNDGVAGHATVTINTGTWLLTGDSTISIASAGSNVFVSSDSGTTAPQVSTSDSGGTRPLVGYVAPGFQVSGANPDPSKVPVVIGQARADAANPELPGGNPNAFKARGYVASNVASLASFTVAAPDGVTFTAGQVVLLTAQTTASQNGPYVVGTVAAGAAPLTRPDWYATGATVPASSIIEVQEGITGANSEWRLTTTGTITVDTTSTTWLPVLQSGVPIQSGYHYVRGVVTSNVATPTSAGAFTVASNDGLTYVQGQRVLLVNQTTSSQNGPYVVGVVSAGTAALIRPLDWLTGSVQPGGAVFLANEGTQGANSQWTCRTAGAVTVDTTSINVDMIGGNWVQGVSTAVGTMANPSSYFFAAALLKARLSGIFEVHLDVAWSDNTTADSVTMALVTDTSASGTLASANKVNHGVTGFGTFGTNGADWESVDTNAGAVLTYNGAAFNTAAQTQASEVNATLTGLLTANGSGTQKFGFHGVVYNAAPTGTTKTPFTLGNTVAFGVKVSATNTITVSSVRMTVRELPSQ